MRLILDSHSRIACPPETKFLVQVAGVIENQQSHLGLRGMGFSDEQILCRMRVFVESFFEEYRKKKNKTRWADKNLHNLDHVETIDKMFDRTPLYVAIIRHGLDVAFSLMDYDWGVLSRHMTSQTPKHVAAMKLWQEQNKKIMSLAARFPSRVNILRYEDLTARPEITIRRTLEFLGEPWEPEVLHYQSVSHDDGFGDRKAWDWPDIQKNSHKYKEWPREIQNEAYQTAVDTMDALGYTIKQ